MDILTIYILTVATILGLVIGSFLNVVAMRLPKGESFVHPPSHCMHCGHQLGVFDLIPVFSFLLLEGRCRYCKGKVSSAYAWGEGITAIAFFLTAWVIGPSPELAVGLFFASILILIAMIDLTTMLIPDKIILFGITVCLFLRCWIHPLPLWNYAAAFFLGGGILYLIAWGGYLFTGKEAMGGGDIKLLALIGLFAGIKLTLLTIFLASLYGTVIGVLLILSGKRTRQQSIPFGPFIAAGAFTAYLWGDGMVEWYVQLFYR